MKTFKVIDPKGIHIDGQLHERGGKISLQEGARLDAFLHFKQIEEVPEKAAKEPAEEPEK